jgi:DNA-directed RNA polymerase specialized sigma24 family protein
MKRDEMSFVDFGYVPPHQESIDLRLINWARWSFNRSEGGVTSPMFRMYRSTDANQQYGKASAQPVDHIDAQRVQKAVSHLPAPHRQALSWCYIKRSNPRKAAQMLGHSMEGLLRLIVDGRQMLVNRGA